MPKSVCWLLSKALQEESGHSYVDTWVYGQSTPGLYGKRSG